MNGAIGGGSSGGMTESLVPTAIMNDLLSGKVTIEDWTSENLPLLRSLSLRSDGTATSQCVMAVDALLWQLQQLELRKSVEFENGVRQIITKLPSIHNTLKELRLPHRGSPSPLQRMAEQLMATEVQVDRLRELMDSKDIEKLRELQRKKLWLQNILKRGRAELEWRRQIIRMQQAMTDTDLDEAQAALENLEELSKTNWPNDTARGGAVDQLRHQLVIIIRNM